MLDFIGFVVIDGFYADINKHFKTVNAGAGRNIDIGILDRYAMFCSLGDGIDFRMNGINAVLFDSSIGMSTPVNMAIAVVAVRKPGGCSVVPGRKNIVIPDNHCTDVTTGTGRSAGNKLCDTHKVFMPAEPL